MQSQVKGALILGYRERNIYERRYHEMVQVVETIKELNLNPVMTSATKEFFNHSLSLGLKEAFPEKPDSSEEVISFMEEKIDKRF